MGSTRGVHGKAGRVPSCMHMRIRCMEAQVLEGDEAHGNEAHGNEAPLLALSLP